MKKYLVLLLVLGGVGTGGYYYTTGRLPWVALSAEEEQIIGLRLEFDNIRQQWQSAGRAQSFGMETTSLADAPIENLSRLEKTLAALLPKLKSAEARNLAGSLRRDITAFRSTMR
jgi:hypothetical protein